ncbi:MAG TPA: bile acid:sodium symporter family protein, partial [Candidatus Hydrogenedentes bacterium]|nr:bile acid:sodium symporter family protein [Candidatus Hydrogenedentota bacterium]
MFNRALQYYTRNLVIWVVLGGVAAYCWPEAFQYIGKGMKWFFALTMFGIGVVLKPQDFRVFGRKPWLVVVGCCAQYTIMPLGAFLLGKAFRLPPEYAVGLILTGAAPGAMTSNVMSYLAKADAAYSVSLTTASTLLCPIMTPGVTYLLAGAAMDVPFTGMFVDLMLTVVVPLLAGFGLLYVA